jgi:hypothetical protein
MLHKKFKFHPPSRRVATATVAAVCLTSLWLPGSSADGGIGVMLPTNPTDTPSYVPAVQAVYNQVTKVEEDLKAIAFPEYPTILKANMYEYEYKDLCDTTVDSAESDSDPWGSPQGETGEWVAYTKLLILAPNTEQPCNTTMISLNLKAAGASGVIIGRRDPVENADDILPLVLNYARRSELVPVVSITYAESARIDEYFRTVDEAFNDDDFVDVPTSPSSSTSSTTAGKTPYLIVHAERQHHISISEIWFNEPLENQPDKSRSCNGGPYLELGYEGTAEKVHVHNYQLRVLAQFDEDDIPNPEISYFIKNRVIHKHQKLLICTAAFPFRTDVPNMEIELLDRYEQQVSVITSNPYGVPPNVNDDLDSVGQHTGSGRDQSLGYLRSSKTGIMMGPYAMKRTPGFRNIVGICHSIYQFSTTQVGPALDSDLAKAAQVTVHSVIFLGLEEPVRVYKLYRKTEDATTITVEKHHNSVPTDYHPDREEFKLTGTKYTVWRIVGESGTLYFQGEFGPVGEPQYVRSCMTRANYDMHLNVDYSDPINSTNPSNSLPNPGTPTDPTPTDPLDPTTPTTPGGTTPPGGTVTPGGGTMPPGGNTTNPVNNKPPESSAATTVVSTVILTFLVLAHMSAIVA